MAPPSTVPDTGLRVLHAAVSMNPSLGAIQQMEWEQEAALELELPWTTVLFTPLEADSTIIRNAAVGVRGRLRRYAGLRSRFIRWLGEVSSDFDLILLRHSVHDPWQARFLATSRKTLTVHHTLEVPELRTLPGLAGRALPPLERLLGDFSVRRARGIVAVTNEIAEYQAGRRGAAPDDGFLVYPNGIRMESVVPAEDRRDDAVSLLFVASRFSGWHGLDLLLDDMEESTESFELHLVGDMPAGVRARCAADARCVVHGTLHTDAMRPLAEKAWIGLSSFALWRKGMAVACTLKVREYLALGVPVYAGHRDVAFPDAFPHFEFGAPSMRDICAFARRCRGMERTRVRDESRPLIDKGMLVDRLYRQLVAIRRGGLTSAAGDLP